MMDKMKMRKKAMEMMMKEAPSISVAVKKGTSPEDEAMSKMHEMMGMEKDEEEGVDLVQMMVSPEEKAMIMQARAGKKESPEDESMEGESDQEMA